MAVIKYPGSTCELDTLKPLKEVGINGEIVDYRAFDPDKYSALILPGGFTYGDYLRAGAIAARNSRGIKEFYIQGKPIIGICNGFQILTEMGLLKGTLTINSTGKFISKWLYIKVRRFDTPLTYKISKDIIHIPIAHSYGRFYEEDLNERLITFTYCSKEGIEGPEHNPNGSILNVAGISSEEGNVIGLMPHPERASIRMISPSGEADGLLMFNSLKKYIEERVK